MQDDIQRLNEKLSNCGYKNVTEDVDSINQRMQQVIDDIQELDSSSEITIYNPEFVERIELVPEFAEVLDAREDKIEDLEDRLTEQVLGTLSQ